MKSLKLFRILPLVASAALLLTCLQASAAGYKLADKAGASIAKFRDDIVDIKEAVDATMVSLDQIVVTAPVDPRKAFKDFDKNVPKIESAAKTAKKNAEAMKEKGQAYFQQWETEMANVNNPDIRKLAEERKAKLQTSFDNIKNTTEPAREQFVKWLDDLKDLQKFLSQDITLSGVEAAKEPIAKAKTEGLAVQQSLEKVIAELNTVVATITPSKMKK
jgi:hypothetical protein